MFYRYMQLLEVIKGDNLLEGLMWFKKLIEINDDSSYEQMVLFGQMSNEFITAMASVISYVYPGKEMTLPKARWVLFTKQKEGEVLHATCIVFGQFGRMALMEEFCKIHPG